MTDWIKHDGGPQPVHEDVWLEIECDPLAYSKSGVQEAGLIEWCGVTRWRILNQHLIDVARLEGIRLGLEAAKRHAEAITALQSGRLVAIPSLNPDTIAKEADND